MLAPHGDQVRAVLERCDHRVYMSDLAPMPRYGKEPVTLAVSLRANRLTVKLGEHALIDQTPLLPILGNRRIGFATWGEALRIEEIELRAPAACTRTVADLPTGWAAPMRSARSSSAESVARDP